MMGRQPVKQMYKTDKLELLNAIYTLTVFAEVSNLQSIEYAMKYWRVKEHCINWNPNSFIPVWLQINWQLRFFQLTAYQHWKFKWNWKKLILETEKLVIHAYFGDLLIICKLLIGNKSQSHDVWIEEPELESTTYNAVFPQLCD